MNLLGAPWYIQIHILSAPCIIHMYINMHGDVNTQIMGWGPWIDLNIKNTESGPAFLVWNHLCNMIYDIYWTIMIFVINVAIILIDRRHSGVLPVLLKDTQIKGCIYYICLWENLPTGIYGADNKTRSSSNISSVGLLGRDPKYVLISSLDIFVKRKLWMLFGPFQKQ